VRGLQDLPDRNLRQSHAAVQAGERRKHDDPGDYSGRVSHQTGEAGSTAEGGCARVRGYLQIGNLKTTKVDRLDGSGKQENRDIHHGEPCAPLSWPLLNIDIHSSFS